MHRSIVSFLSVCILLSQFCPEFVYSDDASSIPGHGPAYIRAAGSAVLSNAVLFAFNRFVAKADYAMISGDSVQANLGSSWVWDQDEFAVNHLGHPYQGSVYYIAGRANGLGFLPSSAITLGNSVLWELFLETETPSRNDLISTTMGGIALGEILHRVSMDVLCMNFPLGVALSPMDGFTIGISAGSSPAMESSRAAAGRSSFSSGRLSLGAGVVSSSILFERGSEIESFSRALTLTLMADAVYGDVFGVPTTEPFSQFEASLSSHVSPSDYSVIFLSDGILLAANPFPFSLSDNTLGLSLHYDVVYSESVNFSANSIGATWKSRRRVFRGAEAWMKIHANWVVLGASDYPYLREAGGRLGESGEERRVYDLGTGEGVKLAAGVAFQGGTRVEAVYAGYGMHAIPSSVPDGGSEGYTLIGTGSIRIERKIGYESSTGASLGFWHKRGRYRNAPDANEEVGLFSLYLRRSFG